MTDKSHSKNRGYSVKSVEDEYWPARLVISGGEVAKFESAALAETVRYLLNQEYFPSQRQSFDEALGIDDSSILTPSTTQSLDMPEGA